MTDLIDVREGEKKIRLAFLEAKEAALKLGDEADLYPQPRNHNFCETDFLREGAWVILCTGFRERVVRKIFGNLSICFCNWSSASSIMEYKDICRQTALDVFRNEKKISAIIDLASTVYNDGFERIRTGVINDPIVTLRSFDYIGPVTAFHFAKNLGFQVAKPDRHLQRVAAMNGFLDAHELCSVISEYTREPISVVDGVLWRLSELGLSGEYDIFDLTKFDGLVSEYIRRR